MAYIPKYAYTYQCYRYNYFNVTETINGIFNNKCYNGATYPNKICETIYDIEEKNPFEAQAAWKYFIDHSVSSEVPTVNSPDDLELISTTGDYDPATGIATMQDDGNGNFFANIGVLAINYPLRNGYYRVEMVIEGVSGETKVQHFSACDNYTTPQVIKPGQRVTINFPFYYDSGAPCSGNESRFIFKVVNDTVNGQCKILKVKLYEVQEV